MQALDDKKNTTKTGCSHLSKENLCLINMVQGAVKQSDCDECMAYLGQNRGLGDNVHKIFNTIGVDKLVKKSKKKGCGCGKRRAALNKLLPSRKE